MARDERPQFVRALLTLDIRGDPLERWQVKARVACRTSPANVASRHRRPADVGSSESWGQRRATPPPLPAAAVKSPATPRTRPPAVNCVRPVANLKAADTLAFEVQGGQPSPTVAPHGPYSGLWLAIGPAAQRAILSRLG